MALIKTELTAFDLARDWFLAGRRVDMGELAAALSISRATLHRRVGSRDQLLGEILWSLSSTSIARLWPSSVGRGAAGVADFVSGYVRFANDAPPFRDFLRREPERALRLLTTKASVCQQRTTAKLVELLDLEVTAGRLVPPLPVPDLAYLLVRIGESFVYTDVITGDAPDASKAHAAVTALLT
ncbi:QsdR family transcriptional regulator [Amycolatopsis sp. NBC_00348]|nr:QsdR family transcriptional regulator [Amycolatopsis sp. WQ 127309]UOZ07869.1 QsdR family transcriptional regulator [Amycolatopsis sp. WQ 127309]WSJ74132.1 QsdR family transcriptional regulator [Amycolatopsis sp. NBC_01307]